MIMPRRVGELRQGGRDERIVFLRYKELAARMGRPGQERLLGDVLDRLRILCEHLNLSGVATMLVGQHSLYAGLVRPADNAQRKYRVARTEGRASAGHDVQLRALLAQARPVGAAGGTDR